MRRGKAVFPLKGTSATLNRRLVAYAVRDCVGLQSPTSTMRSKNCAPTPYALFYARALDDQNFRTRFGVIHGCCSVCATGSQHRMFAEHGAQLR